VASSLLSGLSGYVDIGLIFNVDIDTFVPVSSSIFTKSFAVVLGLICTFRTKVRSSLGSFLSGMTAAWSHGVYTCVLLFVQMNGTFRCLEIAPKDEPDLWGSTKKDSEVLANLFLFSHDLKQKGTEFKGRP
jgi:hypothetical protein